MYDGRRGFGTDARGWDLPRYDDGDYTPPPGRVHQHRSGPPEPVARAERDDVGEYRALARRAIVLFVVVVVVMIMTLLVLRP